MAKITINLDLCFQYELTVSQDTFLLQIDDLKSVSSYHADKFNFADGRTDGRTKTWAMTIPL